MQVKGRYLVIAWTAVFLAAMGVIVLRDSAGFAARKGLDSLDRRIAVLDGKRVDLEARVSELRGRRLLGAAAQALGLRAATDSEMTSIAVPIRR